MAFEGLTDRLQGVFKKLRGKGKIREEDVKTAMREVRLALLEADVNYKVVKDFVADVSEKAVGQEVLNSVTAGQQVVKIVYDSLVEMMGQTESKLLTSPNPPSCYMLVGLQGAGKTTSAGKLALALKKKGKKPLLVAADIYRPAAIKQLQVLGEQLQVEVFSAGQENPVRIVRQALQKAQAENYDPVIIDTAGRLHIDEELMSELKEIKSSLAPQEILLVVDAMTGQDAVNIAENFNKDLGITGIILTKLDGDTRGGAALSTRAVTGCPIKYIGMGEKLEALEVFHPERMASRILGMGDVLTLVEKAQSTFDEQQMKEMERKMLEQSFTLEDFLQQMQQMRSMGPLEDLLSLIPCMGAQMKQLKGQIDEKAFNRVVAMIQAMTPAERQDPAILNGSRKKRIAAGSGCRVQDVNRLLKQFAEMRKLMKQFGGMKKGKKGALAKLKLPF